LRLWDVATRHPLGQALTATLSRSVAFSPDGTTLASSADDGNGNATLWLWSPLLWSNNWRALHNHVCATVNRNLTGAEWKQFLPELRYHETCGRFAAIGKRS
jgi:hypothetical protein